MSPLMRRRPGQNQDKRLRRGNNLVFSHLEDGAMALPALPADFDVAAEFPITREWAFFNHAGVAPIAARAGAAMRQYVQEAERDAYLTGKWYKRAEEVRRAAARIINAHPAELAFVKNTSEGLAFVANGLEWKAGDEIVSTAVEYPSNVYPWMDLQKRFDVEHVMVPEEPDGRIDIQKIFFAVTPRTKMIALSHVEYASGYRNDIAAIGDFCRKRGILLCVDAIQAIGCLPVDVKAMQIDFLSADGHKWMLGPEGLGFFYCRRELIERMRPEVGWMNVINSIDYGNYDFTLRSDAKRFECGSYNIPGVLALGASLDLLLEVGMDTVWGRVDGLCEMIAEGARRKGYRVISPREKEEERSGIVAFVSRTRKDHPEIVQQLEKQRIIIVPREGRLRASPHFYQSEETIRRLIDALPAV
jgi:selenocysteine lyase/cysteine desulfurase